MGRAHDRTARVCNGRHTGFTDQTDVVALQCSCQKGAGIELPAVVPFFMDFARQFLQVLCLQRLLQGHEFMHTFQKSARAFGVFADPVGQSGGHGDGAGRQAVFQWGLRGAAEVQWAGHQVQGAEAGCGFSFHGVCHSKGMPAARSIRQVRIKGRPTSAVGSSLSMDSSKAMPRPSLLALPAQS